MVNIQNYTRKPPDIEVVKVEGDATAMEDIRAWVATHFGEGYNTIIQHNRTVAVEGPNDFYWFVNRGQYVVSDQNDKLFKLDEDQLNAFYDKVE